jgi:hypothetical protein
VSLSCWRSQWWLRVAYVVVPQGADSTPTQHPLPDLAAATARLSVPADFVQVKVLDGASCPA